MLVKFDVRQFVVLFYVEPRVSNLKIATAIEAACSWDHTAKRIGLRHWTRFATTSVQLSVSIALRRLSANLYREVANT